MSPYRIRVLPRSSLVRLSFCALVLLAVPGCSQNGATISEASDRILLTTTGGTASVGALVMAVLVALFGVFLVSVDDGKGRNSKRDNALIALFLLAVSLFSFHEGLSRPIVEVDKGRREVHLRSTLLGLVVREETLRAEQITRIRSRRFTRSGKTRRGEWGSITFLTGTVPVGQFEASQEFVGQAHDLAAKIGAMLKIPVEQDSRGTPP